MTDRSPERLRILAIHRYYWPDSPPYASILRAMAERWVADGHVVEILSTQPSYKPKAEIPLQAARELLNGVRVRRLRLISERGKIALRLLNVLFFCAGIIRHAISQGRFDVIIASTAPPVAVGAVARFAADLTGARFIYHCMDLHPEMGRISGEFENGVVFRFLRLIDTRTCLAAHRAVVLSKDMERALHERPGGRSIRTEIINNFSLPSFAEVSQPHPTELPSKTGKFRILFAGNIGRFQGLETAIDAIHMLGRSSCAELVFMGEGAAVIQLAKRAGAALCRQVWFVPHQPVVVARAAITEADLCLVSLAPGIHNYAFPSKTMSYLAQGRPLLVVVEPESELAAFVQREEVGVVVRPNDPDGMAKVVQKLITNRQQHGRLAKRAAIVGKTHFSEEHVLDKWSFLMKNISAD
jgi:glycosyltransferase involved in cell wall biosynthesis